jgi:hypothetical protein
MKRTHNILAKNPEGKRLFLTPSHDGKAILRGS